MSTPLDARTLELEPDTSVDEAALRRTWETRAGWRGVLATVDHKRIGIRYLTTAFAFLIIGGLESLAMRAQLAGPNLHVMDAKTYNELFSTHGVTMIFLYAAPVLSGFSNYLFPLLLGARDMAFPRANALSYWIYLAAGLFIYAGFAFGYGPNDGWFNYVPNAERTFNPALNQDVYALGLIFLGLSTSVGAANFIATFFRMRAPGMSINRVPIMVWGTLTGACANILIIPAVSLAFFLLWMDRNIGTHFYDAPAGGQPLLWQHLFWMFGHPWVYAIVLPAMGMASDALPVFCRRPLVGYSFVALSTVLTMLLGFGVWVHHMFATGLPGVGLSFFSGASMIIVIPSAVAVFAWTATIWTGRPFICAPFLFFGGFILLFIIGGVSGFMTASAAADLQLTDTYFVVAHIHYVLVGINLFPVLGALFFWFPKMTGRMLDDRLGQIAFWLLFLSFNIGFAPMHWTGLMGMPRRVYTYPAHFGWSTLNLITSVSAFVFAIGVLLVIYNVMRSLTRGAVAGPNPWDAPTLEWSVSSPPPAYNFLVQPIVESRHPLWESRLSQSGPRSKIHTGLTLTQGRETLATTPLDAEPDMVARMPGDAYEPFIMSLTLSILFAALCFHIWWLAAAGAIATMATLLSWLWPRQRLLQRSGASS